MTHQPIQCDEHCERYGPALRQQWYDVIGEATIADAILDRLVHDAHRLELFGESLRKRKRINTMETVEMEE
jgi:hypothetical protein